jgi:hypothetical protein
MTTMVVQSSDFCQLNGAVVWACVFIGALQVRILQQLLHPTSQL